MNQELIVKAACSAAEEVFTTMLGLQVTPGPAHVEMGPSGEGEPVVALIGLAGAWMGTGMLCCSPEFACKLSSLMLMTECSSVDGEVLDAVAEISNMIFGNVKTALEEHVGPLGLSIPTVIFGRNFTTRSVGQQPWTVIELNTDAGVMSMRICLTPNSNKGSVVRDSQLVTAFRQSGAAR
ncbi:MAG TPA: chemotaxis protein CheX [Bryobacteraceae bacterium]|jgi:chemotaxis protein CheX|nr:chemotaxis protein CheX [Bryobacteraceae bacterium]